MAVVTGYSRDDDAYLAFLEDEYTRRKMEDERKLKTEPAGDFSTVPTADLTNIHSSLRQITDRLTKIETSGPTTHTPDPGHSSDKSLGVAAAKLIAESLTKALAKLSGEESDTGKQLRPEFYAQSESKERNRDSSKMDMLDLFYGWACIAEDLVSNGGDIESYLRHVKFATEMLHTRKFYDSGAVKYDRLIMDKFISGKSHRFEPDTVISSLTFSSNVIPDSVELCHGASLTRGVLSYQPLKQQTRRRRNIQATRKSDEIPHDFPTDICFLYNYRQCQDDSCNKSHVCRKCMGRHRADSCKEKTRRT